MVYHLNGDYTIFGKVINGMDVVDKIATEKQIQENDAIKHLCEQSVCNSITIVIFININNSFNNRQNLYK